MLIERMIRAAKLEVGLFAEVLADEGATGQAILIVILGGLAYGLGTSLGLLFSPLGFLAGFFLRTFIVGAILGLGAFFAWVWATQWVGARFFNARVLPYTSFLRPVGFAYTPQIAGVLGFIPLLGGLISLAAAIWALVAMVIAVRESLSLTTGNAIAAGLIAGIGVAVVLGIVYAILTPLWGVGWMMGRYY